MSEQKVAFQSDGLRLDGLLTRPAGAGPFAAFVLLRAIGSRRLNDCTASLGMARTRFYVDDRPDETSAGDVAAILARIATGEAAGPSSTRTACFSNSSLKWWRK